MRGLTIRLFSAETFDVNAPSLTEDVGHLTLTGLLLAADDDDLGEILEFKFFRDFRIVDFDI
jgi:hypothetical protein